jgi:hypothetical protein
MFACQDHCSGGSSGQRQQGRIRRSRSRRLPRQPLPTGDCPRGVHPPTTTRDRRRPRAHPAYGWWPRRWPASPTAAAGSHQAACVDVCDGGDLAFHGPHWVLQGRARRPPAFPYPCPYPRRSTSLDLPLRWSARDRSSAGAWDRRWWPDCDRSFSRAAAHSRDSVRRWGAEEAGGLLGEGCHAQGFHGCTSELVASCLCWTKWCTDG